MHRRTLCENVDSAKIKVPFYTTDIDIILIHCIDISIHIDESYAIRAHNHRLIVFDNERDIA